MAQISRINYSSLNEYLGRIDAEFYKPVSLKADEVIKKQRYKLLGNLVQDGYRVVYGNTKILRTDKVDLHSDVRFLQATNISNDGLWIETKDIGFVCQSDWFKYPKGRIKHGEILIEVKGSAEKVTIVQDYLPIKTLVTGTLFKLTLKENSLSHGYLFAFFSSKYGKILRDRTKVNTLIAYVSKPELYRIPVPIFSKHEETHINKLVEQSFFLQNQSQLLYKQATDLLNKELGLNDIVFENKKSYTARISEVIDSRRMNAEYFSPSIKLILQQPFLADSSPLSAIFQIIRGATPSQYYKEGVPVLKTKNVRLPEIDMEKVQDYVLSTSGLVTIEENDLLLASMGVGSLGRMSFIHEIDQKSIVDGTIRILRKKKTTPRNYEIPTLLFLSSKVGQELIYRGIVGSTGIISLPDDYLYRIPIPKFTQELCDNVTSLVKQSIDAKRESKRLLEQAKLRVEQLIEEAAIKQ